MTQIGVIVHGGGINIEYWTKVYQEQGFVVKNEGDYTAVYKLTKEPK